MSTGPRVQDLSGLQDLPKCRLWSSGRVFRCFCPLCRFALGALPLNMALFRVLRRFEGVLWCGCIFVWVEVFAWLVWVLCACGVRRIRDLLRVCLRFFSSLPLFLSLYSCFLSFVLLCSGCLCLSSCIVFPFLLWLCVFFFPFGIYAKREDAPCLCVLSSCVVGCCYAFANCSRASCHTFSASSGVSPQLFQCWRLAPK